ncbi:MAG TPA: histidine kinase dimerization/phosphoacceptor domain -containing protein, partial [Cyanophyceae cyanobacterium]
NELLERQRAEQALQESKQQLELALEGSGDGFWDWDIASGQVYYNPRYVQMLGYELDEFPREVDGWGKLIHPDDYQRVMEILDAHFKDSSVPYSFDYRLLTKSGEWKWIADYGKIVVRDQDGKPLRMTGTHKDITERKLTENLIKASLREKEVLLKEIHHRVKNNLQIVSSLLQLQSRRTQEKQVTEVLQDSQNRIASIALVHEKLYRSEDLANIDFGQYLPDLITHLFDTYKVNANAVTLSTKVDIILLEIDTAIPCGLIVNELVSNSLKYAFPNNRKGTIQIEFHANNDDTLTLTVRDDGVGIPKEFDIETTSSLGLTLVQGLVDQLEGTIELNRSKGTEFKINFPRL